MPSLNASQWYNFDFLVIQSHPQYIPDPQNPAALVVQPGWVEITTTEQLADVQQQIADLTPVPPPPPNFNQWRYTAMLHFEAVFSAVQAVSSFRSTALVNMIMGLPAGDVPNTITVWNETMSMIDAASLSADFNAIEAAAVINHIPFQISSLGIISERTA